MMHGDYQNGGKKLSCADFDTLLADAIDGALTGSELQRFHAHAGECTDCGPLFTTAAEGFRLLKQLPEVEPPARFVHNILAVTSMREARAISEEDERSWPRRLADFITPNLAPAFGRLWGPRFAMSAAMAFFSLTLVLSVSGVKIADLKGLDLRPSTIRTSAAMTYQQTTAKVVKYYQNIRFVYEWESRLRERRNRQQGERTTDETDQRQEGEQQPGRENGPQQNQNYSLESGQVVMAKLQAPNVAVATDRRKA